MEMEARFDVIYDKNICYIDRHFCREWDEDGGCYGTNPNHGLSFEEAKQTVIDYYRCQARYWKEMTFETWEKTWERAE